jgi:hypothetical protein
MALSNSWDFTVTRDQIIASALRKLGAIPSGATPSTDQITEGAEGLNLVLKSWGSRGVLPYTTEWGIASLTASTVIEGSDANDYTCIRSHTSAGENKPITGAKWPQFWKLLGTGGSTWVTSTAYYAIGVIPLDSQTIDISDVVARRGGMDYPVEVVTWKHFLDIPEKSLYGLSTKAAFDAYTKNLFLWPQPTDTSDTISFKRLRMLMDFDSSTDNPDLPARYYNALVFALAAHLSHEYGIPLEERSMLYQVAKAEFDELRNVEGFMEGAKAQVQPSA